jgi:hypothetical protein
MTAIVPAFFDVGKDADVAGEDAYSTPWGAAR